METIAICCQHCGSKDLVHYGHASHGKQRYRCKSCKTVYETVNGYTEERREEILRRTFELIHNLMRRTLRRIFVRMGEHVTSSHIRQLNGIINYLEVGRWLKANGFSFHSSPRFAVRSQLYEAIASKIKDEAVLYLEFGVWQGKALRMWGKLLRNPLSSLHGFDSFEGLPEAWSTWPKGSFDLKGVAPQFDDPRIILHKGWFHETLPDFVLPKHERLLINFDADLYSSATYVLDTLREAIRPGTIIIFDEFHDRLHELKAFSEFLETSQMKFRFLGAAWDGALRCAFERIE